MSEIYAPYKWPKTDEVTCRKCEGYGYVTKATNCGDEYSQCPDCSGKGVLKKDGGNKQ